MRMTHEQSIEALEANIQWREENKGVKGHRYTASSFPYPNLFFSDVYGPYRWGIFYDHRFYGFSLSTRYKEAFEKVKIAPWEGIQQYKSWRDGASK